MCKHISAMVMNHFKLNEADFGGAISTLIHQLKESKKPYEKSLYPEVQFKRSRDRLLNYSCFSRIDTENEKAKATEHLVDRCNIGFGINQESPLGEYTADEKRQILQLEESAALEKIHYTFADNCFVLNVPRKCHITLNANGGFSRRENGKVIILRKQNSLTRHARECRTDKPKMVADVMKAWDSCEEVLELVKIAYITQGLNYRDLIQFNNSEQVEDAKKKGRVWYDISKRIRTFSLDQMREWRDSAVNGAKCAKAAVTDESLVPEKPASENEEKRLLKLLELPSRDSVVTYEGASDNFKEVLTGVETDSKNEKSRKRAFAFLQFTEISSSADKVKIVSAIPKVEKNAEKSKAKKLMVKELLKLSECDNISSEIKRNFDDEGEPSVTEKKTSKSKKSKIELVVNDEEDSILCPLEALARSGYEFKQTVRKTVLGHLTAKSPSFGGIIHSLWQQSMNKSIRKEIYLSVPPDDQMHAWVHEYFWKRVSGFLDIQAKQKLQNRNFTYFPPEIFANPEAFEDAVRADSAGKIKFAATFCRSEHYVSCIFDSETQELEVYDSVGNAGQFFVDIRSKFRKIFEVAGLPEFVVKSSRIYHGPIQKVDSNDCAIYSILYWWSRLVEPVKRFDDNNLSSADIYFFRVLADLNLCEFNSAAAKKIGRTLIDDLFVLQKTDPLKKFGTITWKFLNMLREGLVKPFDLDPQLHQGKQISDYSFQVFAKCLNSFCDLERIDFAVFPRRQLEPGVWADSVDVFPELVEKYSATTRAGIIFLDGRHYYTAMAKADCSEGAGEVIFYDGMYQDLRCQNVILETLAEISRDKFASLPVSVATGPIQPNGYDCGAYAAAFILHQMELLATSSSSSNVTTELSSLRLFSSSDKLSEELVFALRVTLALCENYYNEFLRCSKKK